MREAARHIFLKEFSSSWISGSGRSLLRYIFSHSDIVNLLHNVTRRAFDSRTWDKIVWLDKCVAGPVGWRSEWSTRFRGRCSAVPLAHPSATSPALVLGFFRIFQVKFEIPNHLDPFCFSETRPKRESQMWWKLGDASCFCKQQDKTFVSLLFCRMCKRTLGLGSRAQLSLVAREILFTRDATETTFSSLHTPLSSLRSMLLWIVLSTLSHLVCLSVADGVIASESCFPAGRDIRACYYSGPFQTRSECLVTIESRL